MYGKFPALAATAFLLSAATATGAQARDIRSLMGKPGVQISSSFQTSVPVTGQMSVEEEARATESARKALYQIAARECDVIKAVFKGECRMTHLNVRSFIQDRGNGARQISVSANATYTIVSEYPPSDSGEKKL
ncbi:MAG: hypothetical protein AB7F96_07880 [Beijerinckiaceae bacterium]